MAKALRVTAIFILFCGTAAFGQERPLTGVVTTDEGRLSSAHIRNKNNQQKTSSNDIGEFFIRGKSGDTLITNKEGYDNDTLVITTSPYLAIRLKKPPLALKEVEINSTLLTPEKKLAENKTAYKEIYRKGDKSNMIVITPLGVGVVIDKVWSAVSKEGADARRLQRTFIADYENSIIDRRFSKTLVGQVTGYKNERLFNFMSKYRPSYKMTKSATDYELIQYIKKCLAAEKPKFAGK